MAGPVLCATVLLMVSILNPAYSSVRQRVSELGAPQAPHAAVADALGIAIPGVLIALFSIGLYDEVRRSRAAAAGSALIGVSGVAVILAGILPTGPGGVASSGTAVAHAVFARIGEFAILGAPLALWTGLRGSGRWRGFSQLALAVAIVAASMYAVYQLHSLSPWKGVLQRSLIAVTLLWIEIMSIRLLLLTVGARNGPEEPDLRESRP